MGRADVLQISGIDKGLWKKIDDYREEKNLKSRSETGKELIEFAFKVIEHVPEEEAVSTRELLEEILMLQAKTWNLQNNTYFQTYNDDKYKGDLSLPLERKNIAVEKAEKYVEDFLAGNEKEGG